MRRGVSLFVLGALAVGGIAAGVFAPGSGASPKASSAKVFRVTVKASEFKFVLSRKAIPTTGTVIFTVVNKGKITHDFKILGKKTKLLNPGKKAVLRIVFKKKKKYPYICTVRGHAKLGMKGIFYVGVKVPKVTPAQTTTTSTPATPPSSPPTTTSAAPAPPQPAGPVGSAKTTVQVGLFEYRFELSQSTIPSGQVTFVITNKGKEVHNFAIDGGKMGSLLPPGGTETWTVSLPPKKYGYECTVPFHAEYGMVGVFTVTP